MPRKTTSEQEARRQTAEPLHREFTVVLRLRRRNTRWTASAMQSYLGSFLDEVLIEAVYPERLIGGAGDPKPRRQRPMVSREGLERCGHGGRGGR